jgi:ABC-type arginine transport system ATPase subunit
MSDLELFEISHADDSKINLIKENLPKPYKGALRWVLLGPSTAGKSTLIKNVLYNIKWGYDKYFDEFYVFCGSMDDCHEMRQLRAKYENYSKVQ